MFSFCWMVNGILFHINGPIHKKLLEDFTVREVKGRMCEVCLVLCMSWLNVKISDK